MSKVDFHRNTFLEIEELNRFQKFMVESNVNKTFLSNTINWGIIDTSGGTSPNDFKVEASPTPSTVMIQYLSRALQKDGLLIEQQPIDGIAIANDSAWYWIKIGHTYTHLEEGTCSITINGTVTGNGTKFTEVLRGVSSKVPVKVMFTSTNNTGIYDVVNVVDDLNIIIQGDSFIAESGITYRVIGSTPLGETVTSEQQNGLYSYDSCVITKVAETVTDTPPAGLVTDEEFWIARVRNVGGTVTVQDKREYTTGAVTYSQYWEYYIRGVSDKLDKNNNLSDLANVVNARYNLSVYSQQEINNLFNITSKSWMPMNRGSAATEFKFDIKVCRIGLSCTITGTFTSEEDAPVGSILASLPWTSLESPGLALTLTNNVYTQVTNLADSIVVDDKELFIYVEARGSSDDLQIKTLKIAPKDIGFMFTLTFNLI